MGSAILINWTSPFPILGVSGKRFHFYFLIEIHFLWRLILLRIHLWDARHIRVKQHAGKGSKNPRLFIVNVFSNENNISFHINSVFMVYPIKYFMFYAKKLLSGLLR